MFGFFNINKSKGMTSHDVVSKLRRVLKIKQIGHTGTLDPLAQGVLPIAVGKATRLIEYLDEKNKEYVAVLELGKISDTYDCEGIIQQYSDKKISENDFLSVIDKYRGEIEQVPPAYSALHYKGKRLYDLARQGITPVDIPARTVYINKLNLLDFDYESQTATIDVGCSRGTYIRSLINDIGINLGTGAIMTALTRTKSGVFSLKNAVSPELLSDNFEALKYLINPVYVLSYKCYQLTEIELQKIKHGQSIETKHYYEPSSYICLEYNNQLCALAKKDAISNKLIIQKVFIQ